MSAHVRLLSALFIFLGAFTAPSQAAFVTNIFHGHIAKDGTNGPLDVFDLFGGGLLAGAPFDLEFQTDTAQAQEVV